MKTMKTSQIVKQMRRIAVFREFDITCLDFQGSFARRIKELFDKEE
jgi:hypothetical protein